MKRLSNSLLCITCGGKGERLWPLSTSMLPKQFKSLYNEKSLLQNTLYRNDFFDNIALMFNQTFMNQVKVEVENFISSNRLSHSTIFNNHVLNISSKAININKNYTGSNFFLVPEKQKIDTTWCAIIASHLAIKLKLNTVVLAPVDHVINNKNLYKQDICNIIQNLSMGDISETIDQNKFQNFNTETDYSYQAMIKNNSIITIGIKPKNPTSEYGYISSYPYKFIEKPNLLLAINLLKDGWYWNSGIYIFKPCKFLKTVSELLLQQNNSNDFISNLLSQDYNSNFLDIKTNCGINYTFFDDRVYSNDLKSIDREVSQKTNQIAMVPANFDWIDIGSYHSLWLIGKKDANLNVIKSSVKIDLVNVKNCYLDIDDSESNIPKKLSNLKNLGIIVKNHKKLIKNLTMDYNADDSLEFNSQKINLRIDTIWEKFQQGIELKDEDVKAVHEYIDYLDKGIVKTANKINDEWIVNANAKKAILIYIKLSQNKEILGNDLFWLDKLKLKNSTNFSSYEIKLNNSFTDFITPHDSQISNKEPEFTTYKESNSKKYFKEKNIRIVPPAVVRYGSFIGENVILMPSFVNIGAHVGSKTMIDTWATVGSCAYIGSNCHISGGVGIGGVLEPAHARPVIIEDNCFIGARSQIAEGTLIKSGSVIGMGVYIGMSTKIIDIETKEVYYGVVPENSVVVQGGYEKNGLIVSCPVIIKKADEKTRQKTSINELLRSPD